MINKSLAGLPRPDRRQLLAGIAATVASTSVSAQPPPSEIVLTAAPGKRRLRPEPAAETDVWCYNGETPGPLIRLKVNQPATIRLHNRLPQPTTLHLSGHRGVNAMDGVAGLTQAAVNPGESFGYSFTPRDAGVFLYHPLVPAIPGGTSEQAERGLSGMMIVEEANWQAEIDRDIAVMIDDWRLTEADQIDPVFALAADTARLGRLGNTLTVNGKTVPEVITLPPRARVRLRIGGIMNARIAPMTFRGMVRATVLGIDGQPCEPFDPLRKQVIVAPGSRYDMVMDLPETAGAEAIVAVVLGEALAIMRLVTAGDPVPVKKPIPELPPNPLLPPALLLQRARRAEFNIAGGWSRKDPAGAGAPPAVIAAKWPDAYKVWTLNHGFPSGVAGKPIFSVKKGTVVVVALTNRSDWPQVIRLHGHVVRVLHALDDGWEPFFLDTVIVPENRVVRIAFNADNVGKWLIRSTIIEHMEGGVISWFEVLP
ncbi:MAG: multicopper oxidase family protein [Methylocystis sp.]|nr:multicopper oxidase family protein [Methylocystis sp.]MCA3584023.1 multicopper oxidase family protein [Methylocystis sp.]MCA3586667.1 multicopper oxidase family protein [Methylocystis sp.]MCA3591637.1 multicopper oxidase family protein [Methylocystis sp.]